MDEDNISFGWNVSSDLSLDVIGDESQIFLTCQAVSRDHQGQVMTAKAELEVLVLSELLLLLSDPNHILTTADFIQIQSQAISLRFVTCSVILLRQQH